MKAFCVECTKVMERQKIGVAVFINSNMGLWRILWVDRYQCPKCGKQILSDFGVTYYDNYGFNEVFAREHTASMKSENYNMFDF